MSARLPSREALDRQAARLRVERLAQEDRIREIVREEIAAGAADRLTTKDYSDAMLRRARERRALERGA